LGRCGYGFRARYVHFTEYIRVECINYKKNHERKTKEKEKKAKKSGICDALQLEGARHRASRSGLFL